MTVVTVAFDGTRISGAESSSDGGEWDKWDANQTPSDEEDFVYQGVQAISNKIGTSRGGVELQDALPTVNFTTGPSAVLFKVMAANYGVLGLLGVDGMILYVGSANTTDQFEYYVHGRDTYPKAGGWLFILIDPNESAYRDVTVGTPALTVVEYYAISCDFTATSKSENVVCDALDFFTIGEGYLLTGGTSGDPDGTFLDFIAADEGGVATISEVGAIRTIEGIILGLCTFRIGVGAATVFTDDGSDIVFPDARVGAGTLGFALNLATSGTIITITNGKFTGRGRTNKRVIFDTENEVDGTQDEIDAVAHGFETGDAVNYSDQGGSETIGLTDATQSFVEKFTDDILRLHTTLVGSRQERTETDTFNTELDVDGSLEEITLTAHGLTDGQPIQYDDGGGSETIGLTQGVVYYANNIGTNLISVHLTRAAAIADTGRVDLTASALAAGETHSFFSPATLPIVLTASTSGNGESHFLQRQPDVRPDCIVTGNTGTLALTGDTFVSFRQITFTSACTVTSCKFVECLVLILGTAEMDFCTVTRPATILGDAFILTADLADITNTSFEMGEANHAIEITAIGTYAFNGHTLVGYWAHSNLDVGDGATFNASTGVDGGTEVITTDEAHGFASGDFVYYNDEGGTTLTNLTDGGGFYVNVITATTLSLHVTEQDATSDTNRIDLTAGVNEEHALYSSKAAVFNDTGGLVTINVGGGGDAPTVRNGVGASTVVNNNVQVTLDNLQDNTEIRVFAAGTTTPELAGIENATAGTPGDRNFAFSLAAALDVDIRIFAIAYEPADLVGFTIPNADATIPIQQRFDRTYFNPD